MLTVLINYPRWRYTIHGYYVYQGHNVSIRHKHTISINEASEYGHSQQIIKLHLLTFRWT